jgi:DUF4097 and DUF4098 domain-containing protein YvlB
MNRDRHSASRWGAVLGASCALVVFAVSAHASDHSGSMTEEFHHTYTLPANGRVELDNINGDVHITSWDRNEVKVDAVKYANSKDRLDEAKIEIDAKDNSVSIRTRYPDHNQTFNWGSHNNPAGIEYTLTVPRAARLDEIKLINGELDINGVSGEVHASCINGRLEAHNLAGRSDLSTINGRLEAHFDQLPARVELNSVNGSLALTIPSDSKAEIEASTVSGSIANDFGLHVNRHQYVGHDLRGSLGGGGTQIKLDNVNGKIEIHHAQDGRALSPVKDLGDRDEGGDSI